MLDIDHARVDAAAKMLAANPDVLLGIKVRETLDVVGSNGNLSELLAVSVNTPGKPFLPWVMSKFLNLGMPLEQVVTLATSAPSKAIGRVPKLGALQVGAPADLSLVEIVAGPVDFVDTRQNQRKGQRHIKPMQTVKAGRPFGRPYPQPFAWP